MTASRQRFSVHVLLAAVTMAFGCVYRAAPPPPPAPLDGVTSVVVSFDYSTLLVNGMGGAKSEAEWVAAKSAEDPDYPRTWSDLKAQWEQHFMAGFAGASPVPVSRYVEGAPAPMGGAVLKVSMSEFQLGKYIPFATQQTSVRTAQTWWRNDQMVQSSATAASVTPGITTPSVFQHVRPIGEQSGQQTGRTLRDRPSYARSGGGGGFHIHVHHRPHRSGPRHGFSRRRW